MTYMRYDSDGLVAAFGQASVELVNGIDRLSQVADFVLDLQQQTGAATPQAAPVTAGLTSNEATAVVQAFTAGLQLRDVFNGDAAGPANPIDVRALFVRLIGPARY